MTPLKTKPITVFGLEIEGGDRLDRVTVYFRDVGPRKGQIVVYCYGNAWTAYWEAHGDRTIREFVAQLDAEYLASKLMRGTEKSREMDYLRRIAEAVIQGTRQSLGLVTAEGVE